MASVFCIGMSALDAVYCVSAIPTTGAKILASAYAESGGGMAANASLAVARLGGRAAYCGRLGDDALGDRIVGALRAEGVDVSDVRRIRGAVSPSAAILVASDGERLICAYNDPALDTDAAWLRLDRIASFDAVLADVRWPQGSTAALSAARAAGRVAVLDADVGPLDVLDALTRLATHVVYSQPALAEASGTEDPGLGLRRVARGDCFVGVTLGADGCLWLDGGIEGHAPAPTVRVVDTLAAGDVWHGAFTVALAEGCPADESARFANVAAAIKCSRSGGRSGCPTRADVDSLLNRLKIR